MWKETKTLEDVRNALQDGAMYRDVTQDTKALNELCVAALELLNDSVMEKRGHSLCLRSRVSTPMGPTKPSVTLSQLAELHK